MGQLRILQRRILENSQFSKGELRMLHTGTPISPNENLREFSRVQRRIPNSQNGNSQFSNALNSPNENFGDLSFLQRRTPNSPKESPRFPKGELQNLQNRTPGTTPDNGLGPGTDFSFPNIAFAICVRPKCLLLLGQKSC